MLPFRWSPFQGKLFIFQQCNAKPTNAKHITSITAAWLCSRGVLNWKHLVCLEKKNMKTYIQDWWAAGILYQTRSGHFSPKSPAASLLSSQNITTVLKRRDATQKNKTKAKQPCSSFLDYHQIQNDLIFYFNGTFFSV